MESTKIPINDRVDKENIFCIYYIHYIYCVYNIHTHAHTMEYYTLIKKNKIMYFAATIMKLEVIIISELTQEQKTKYLMFSFK